MSKLINKLDAFKKAADELHTAWLQANQHDAEDLENATYPFHQDFGEICQAITAWVNISKGEEE